MPTAKENARSLVAILNFKRDLIDRIIESAEGIYGSDEYLNAEQQEEKKLTVETVASVCDDTVEGVIDQVIDAYSGHYSAEELQELVDWYTSPLGQKVLAEGKTLTVEIADVMEAWGNNIWNIVKLRRGWTSAQD